MMITQSEKNVADYDALKIKIDNAVKIQIANMRLNTTLQTKSQLIKTENELDRVTSELCRTKMMLDDIRIKLIKAEDKLYETTTELNKIKGKYSTEIEYMLIKARLDKSNAERDVYKQALVRVHAERHKLHKQTVELKKSLKYANARIATMLANMCRYTNL